MIISEITDKILSWYDNNKIDMPWRGESDPYKVWLSEIMLQQTQINTVIKYYNRWINRFPSIRDVAQSSQQEILKYWEGLGYYTRARNFHQSCIELKKTNYRVPDNINDFIKLKGVGPYIGNAVQSIAFNAPLAVVDSNVNRIVSRFKGYTVEPLKNKKAIQKYMNSILDTKRPGDFNQAMMDLGRYICKPTSPLCTSCPLAPQCIAFKKNLINDIPTKAMKKTRPHYKVVVGIIWQKDKLLITKRKENGLLGGLWEFPGGKVEKNENAFEAVKREILEELSISIETKEVLDTINHQYSHFTVTISAIQCKYIDGKISLNGPEEYMWIKPSSLNDLPFPRASTKLFHTVKGYKCLT